MGITEKQREVRKGHLGSSDMPALLGLSPWSNAYDVWLDKTGRVETDKPETWMTTGQFLEAGILDWAEKELGKLTRNQYRTAPEFHLGSHNDAIVDGSGNPVEVKNGGPYGDWSRQFGEPGTDQVPPYVIIQGHVHMICLDGQSSPRVCHVPFCRGGQQLVMYEVLRDERICDAIKEAACRFWVDHVLADKPPDDCLPTLDIVRHVRREPETTAIVDPKLMKRWRAAKAAKAWAETVEDETQAALLAAMGDAEGADGGKAGTVTFLEQQGRSGFDADKMRADGVFDLYRKRGKPFRVLRHKENK